MKTSNEGIRQIKRFEGLRLNAYRDCVGVPTIGYGHTQGVKMGDAITEQQAEALLRQDLQPAEAAINTHVKVPLTQGQFDALASFVFNLGSAHFITSTLLGKINAGDKEGAAAEFSQWVHAGGKIISAFVERRAAERDMFIS